MGHTDMSNDDYSEIKDNPSINYERLAEILANSPISADDYENLLITARSRQEKRLRNMKRDELENRLSAMLTPDKSKPEPAFEPVGEVTDATEEISLITDDVVTAYRDIRAEDVWSEVDSGNFGNAPDLTEQDVADYAEFGGSEDFDNNAVAENRVRTFVCTGMAVLLVFASFLIRYITTGEWGIASLALTDPQSYAEVFELQQTQRLQQSRSPIPPTRFRAERFTDVANPLAVVASSDRYLFRAVGNDVRAVEINAGLMSDAAAFVSESVRSDGALAGIFAADNRLYAVYTEWYQTNLPFPADSRDAETFIFSQPRVIIYEFSVEFDAPEFGEPLKVYRMDGGFREILLHENGFFVITDFAPRNSTNPDELAGFIPSFTVGEEQGFVALENIEFVPDAGYSDMTVIGNISRAGGSSSFEVIAVAGGSAEYVHSGDRGGSLILSLYCTRANRSSILRYGVFGGLVNSGNPAWATVSGRVGHGFIDERGGVVRVVAESRGSGGSTLFILDAALRPLATAVRSVAANSEEVEGVAFDENTVYVIAQRIYAINTANPANPVFLNEINALIADTSQRNFYQWDDRRFFEVGVSLDESGERDGIMLTMYYVDGGAPAIEQMFRLPIHDAVWQDFIRSSAEHMREAVAVSHDAVTGSGAIVVPVAYFNAVSRVENFFILSYSQEYGFVVTGRITEFGFRSREHAAVVQSGFVYAMWEDMIRSAATDSTTIAIHRF
jgi:hypothetical protein